MLVTQATHGAMETQGSGPAVDSGFGKQQEQIKAGWSLLSTLHCVLLSDKVKALGSPSYKKLQVELLAVKWQDRCLQVEYHAFLVANFLPSVFLVARFFPSVLLVANFFLCDSGGQFFSQVRLAAQELLVAELKNLGSQVQIQYYQHAPHNGFA